jgi:hypothetical protein
MFWGKKEHYLIAYMTDLSQVNVHAYFTIHSCRTYFISSRTLISQLTKSNIPSYIGLKLEINEIMLHI